MQGSHNWRSPLLGLSCRHYEGATGTVSQCVFKYGPAQDAQRHDARCTALVVW